MKDSAISIDVKIHWWQRLFQLLKMLIQPIRYLFTGRADIY